MALRLQVVSKHRQGLRERSTKEFGQNGGTIGRSLESDWVLPDAQRFVSSRHASIDFRSGSYYIIDTSSNGLYINGSNTPVGRGNPQRLFPGDRIRMGDYEMVVEIDESDSTKERIPIQPHVDPVDLMQRVDAPEPVKRDLVDPFEITGVGIETLLDQDQATTLSPLDYGFTSGELALVPDQAPSHTSAPAAAPSPAAPSAAAKPRESDTARVRTNAAQPPPIKVKRKRKISARAGAAAAPVASVAPIAAPAVEPTPVTPALTLDAFFRGAGMPVMALDEQQSEALLLRLGQLMRETIAGLTENLHLRAAQKSLLRQSNTTIQPGGNNNSLKFSAGVDEALNNLLFRDSEQYLDAVQAVRDAFDDIRRHQQILMKAMLEAVVAYIERVDPEHLEQKFSNGRTGIMAATNKLKYWDLFKDLYQVLSQRNPGEFPAAFLEEIARTYDAEATRVTGMRAEQKVKASVA
ncbi:MAG TPA: type VI secretion system-associated FHA domain protein TagH [Gammaproteobacteria bacterium]|jgi:type VI secretion system protein